MRGRKGWVIEGKGKGGEVKGKKGVCLRVE